MYRHIRGFYLAALVLSLFLVTACTITGTVTVILTGDTQTPDQLSTVDQGNHSQVIIQAATFVPLKVDIKIGDTVTWVNQDADSHTVTTVYHFQDEDDVSHIFIGETWDSGDIAPGQSYSRTFDESGTFEYLSLPLHTPSPMDQYFAFVAQYAVGVVVVS